MVAPVCTGRLIGYARVSTDDQDLTLQIDSLTGMGINPDDIFTEKISGAKLHELHDRVADEIREKGAYVVSTEAGMFICS